MMGVSDKVLGGLKRFQRATVEHVFQRLYLDKDATDRFLIADEVGLGKTMIARGLVAKALDHFEDSGKRIDVVYVCSNQVIAHQNVTKLMVAGERHEPVLDRVTMLPAHVKDLESHRVNLIPLTPQTSLDLRSNVGARRERVLLWHLLAHEYGHPYMKRSGPRRFFQGPCRSYESFDWGVKYDVYQHEIDAGLRQAFLRHVKKARTDDGEELLLTRFERLADSMKRRKALETWEGLTERDRELNWARNAALGQLRRALACSCIDALEPDLVILDEFQRFRNLLDPEHPAGELADLLFDHPDAKVLLLSATPYKMLTRDVEGNEEDHYRDFLGTLRFLLDEDEDAVAGCRESLADLRRGLQQLGDGGRSQALEAKADLEARLRQVMVRTERLAVRADRNGMVKPAPTEHVRLTASDVRAFADLDRIARSLGAHDAVEYWKSTPYALNFMDGYVLSTRFEEQARRNKAARPHYGLLDAKAVRAYEAIDPGNARMRGLVSDMVERGLWKLLWLPPSLPYYRLGSPFTPFQDNPPTKRLIFSAWTVVPRAIACLVSYEAERRLISEGEGSAPEEYTAAARAKLSAPLRFAATGESNEEAANMTTFTLMYPSRALAELVDPLTFLGDGARAEIPTFAQALQAVEKDLRPRIRALTKGAEKAGREDVSWYAAIPLLMDSELDSSQTAAWLEDDDTQYLVGAESADDDEPEERLASRNWELHLQRAREILDRERLGRPPKDLVRIVSLLALAAPAVCVRRSLKRAVPDAPEMGLRHSAVEVADQLRGLLNQPEVAPLIRATDPGTRYWEDALRYCAHGCLQAVLDEYAHVLREWAPIHGDDPNDRRPEEIAASVANAMYQALSLRSPDYEIRDIDGRGIPKKEPLRMRSRFAHQFADARSSEEGQVSRAVDVRAAFNSPFWPFVLATTSVGQEGLDFHLYCHAVMHWNLPANPVDFEQREGRVHRYKGHAVRINLASLHGRDALGEGTPDPWATMFEAADHKDGDLQPYWILCDGPARILRFVPSLAWSRDERREAQLEKLLASYRLAFGQPRQDDLLAYLGELELEQQEIEDLMIDLSPPRLAGPTSIGR